ncbi:MAG: choice-of-anchor tandem repeat GloVer-containing protein [Candidatus Korobacteraceae bacterium]
MPKMKFSFGITKVVGCLCVLATFTLSAFPQTYSVIHNFTGGPGGNYPYDGLTMDRAGNFYGTTYGGGSSGQGIVFKLSKHNTSWIFTPIYSFRGGNDGAFPYAGVTIGPDGNLYGTTSSGGLGAPECPGGCGTVYKLTPPANICHSTSCSWSETVLYNFYQAGVGLSTPWAGVIFDAAGNMYGTTTEGGAGGCPSPGCGAVYKLTRTGVSWTATIIYSFTGYSDGAVPYAGLVMNSAGDLYGASFYSGGLYQGYGAIFELINSGGNWSERTLYDFQGGNDGGNPEGGLIIDAAGNLYGGTSEANGNYLTGVAFELSPSGSNWTYSVLASFNGSIVANLSLDSAGDLYGTTLFGGAHGFGSVFKLSNSGGGWTPTDLHDFSNQNHDGFGPWCNVAIDVSGNLFGTTNGGGTTGGGIIWEITP